MRHCCTWPHGAEICVPSLILEGRRSQLRRPVTPVGFDATGACLCVAARVYDILFPLYITDMLTLTQCVHVVFRSHGEFTPLVMPQQLYFVGNNHGHPGYCFSSLPFSRAKT